MAKAKHTVSPVISDYDLNCIISIESNGNPLAKAKTSTATGLGQFLNKTWMGVVRKHAPQWSVGKTEAQVLALRKKPEYSIFALARFTEDNAAFLGRGWTPGDLYLAHFLGTGDARKVLRAPQNERVEGYVSDGAVRANRSILEGKTVGQVRAWAARKMATHGNTDWIAKYWRDIKDVQTPVHDPIPEDVAGEKVESDWSAVDVDEEDTTHAPSDATPHGEVNDQIANLQKALVGMNYNEVGTIEGGWGGGTKAAIAAFLNDRGRDDLKVDMSQPVLDEVARAVMEGFKRPVAAARAEITPTELAKSNTTVSSTLWTKFIGFWGTVSGGVALAYQTVASQFHSVWDATRPVRQVLDAVPGFVWIVGIIGACLGVYILSKRAENDTVAAFKNRRLLR